jgi:DNA-binding transcriptional regulator LsrR (DeoR family)
MATLDELRVMTKIAKMYFEWNLNQTEIAQQLGMSQATVSRLFKRAKDEGVIRISIQAPPGVNTNLEEKLVKRFGLKDAIVVDSLSEDENQIMRDLGAAAAFYLETVIKDQEVIGISSWSSSLLAVIDALRSLPGKQGISVVQILGGVGNPSAEAHATRLTARLASLVGGTAVFLPAPGMVGSEATLRVWLEDRYVQEAVQLFDRVTLALVGIGAVEPSPLLSQSGNILTSEEQAELKKQGAAGDVLLRFFDLHGKPVESSINQRVMSMTLEQLRSVPRSIGIAGGQRKYHAILGALRGGWINVLITDRATAEQLN